MLTPKESVFDRIEQSLVLFKNNFIQIFLPLFIYKILTTGFIFSVISYFILNPVDLSTLNLNNIKITGVSSIFMNNYFYLFLTFTLLFLVYLLLIIPFFIATVKAIKNSYFEVENNMKDNIVYGFSRLFSIFKTYWYIFAYVFLVPALAFIIGSVLLILGTIKNVEMFINFGISLTYFSVILFFVFLIYRGIETSFSLYCAIDKDEFDKENFDNSINLTINNWWRIVGNFLIFLLIIFLFLIILLIFIKIPDLRNFLGIFTSKGIDFEKIRSILDVLKNFNILEFIGNLFNILLNSFIQIFSYVFIYIFYKRLELEKNGDTTSKEELKISKDKKIIKEL